MRHPLVRDIYQRIFQFKERRTVNENTPGNKRMTMEDMVKITSWVTTHKADLPNHTLAQLRRMLKADTGINCQPSRLSQFERAAGFERPKGGTQLNKKDRSVVIAQVLRDLLVRLGTDVPDDLKDICNGR